MKDRYTPGTSPKDKQDKYKVLDQSPGSNSRMIKGNDEKLTKLTECKEKYHDDKPKKVSGTKDNNDDDKPKKVLGKDEEDRPRKQRRGRDKSSYKG